MGEVSLDTKIAGRVWVYGDDVNTGRYKGVVDRVAGCRTFVAKIPLETDGGVGVDRCMCGRENNRLSRLRLSASDFSIRDQRE